MARDRKEYHKQWYAKNRERILARQAADPTRTESVRAWKERNKDRARELNRESYQRVKAERNKRVTAYRRANPAAKIAANLRSRLNKAVRGLVKQGSAVRDLGCSVPELKKHLEDRFLPGMSWENYGPKGWHIDHILPLSSFDLQERDQFLAACHYTNLQPLWATDNLVKNDKVTSTCRI
jgi:arginine decarboxylase-like protein